MVLPLSVLSVAAALAVPAWAALTADLSSASSIRDAASTAAYDLMSMYRGNLTGQIPGILPGPPPGGPYYWWEGGALWGTMVDYWHYTGDTSYNDVVMQALLFQTGPLNNYMPNNWSASLGNDDQAFWGMSALLAAETNFPNPPPEANKQWLALAQAVFNTQASPDRRDDSCGGGLHWQIFPTNNGYMYKNSIANGGFFNMGARLARYTNNDTYAEWSRKTWDWMVAVGFLDQDYNIYDGGDIAANCTDLHPAQFSYNAAIFLQGAAYMYNYTTGSERQMWQERTAGLLNNTIKIFFPNGIAYEVSCEGVGTCNEDMKSFKGYLHRWMAVTAQIAPFTRDAILAVLKTSTEAALKTCTGGPNGRMCGLNWSAGTFGGSTDAGFQMNIVGALTSYLIALESVSAPVTNSTGGTSVGNPSAGAGSDNEWWLDNTPLPTKDKVGAGFLTAILLVSAVAMFVWMSMDEKAEGDTSKGSEEKGKGKSVLPVAET